MNERCAWLQAEWPAHGRVRAVTTLRSGGVSRAPYAGLNLATHVGDDARAVAQNRDILQATLALPGEPVWLSQVHGSKVVNAALVKATEQPAPVVADAAWTDQTGVVCAVLTADCLPVILTDSAGQCVAAVHAGWRGLLAGVLEQTVASLPVADSELLAWLGPAIGPTAFEVGRDVYQCFIDDDAGAQQAFVRVAEDHWLADLYQLARIRLQRLAIHRVFGGQWCTYIEAERFYSYRRDGETGRMATLIWLS